MAYRHDQQVTQIHRLDIHERYDEVIAVDETRGRLAGKDPAEDTVGHGGNLRLFSLVLFGWLSVSDVRNEPDRTRNKTVAYPPTARYDMQHNGCTINVADGLTRRIDP
jgi:hypothetical protein